jgi:LysR family transcriptional regulator, transcriptional activator for bauABCD operon
LLAPLNTQTMRYRVTFQMVTRARATRRDIVDAFVEDMASAHGILTA